MADLPFIDEHHVTIDAPVDDVWPSLLEVLGTMTSGPGATYARAVGCQDTKATGPRPLAEGSTIPGFHVVRAREREELALEGRHRFSTYALTFRLEQDGPERSRVRAETRATFPGLLGHAYRAAVIRSGAHATLMRRLLTSLRTRSTAATRA